MMDRILMEALTTDISAAARSSRDEREGGKRNYSQQETTEKRVISVSTSKFRACVQVYSLETREVITS